MSEYQPKSYPWRAWRRLAALARGRSVPLRGNRRALRKRVLARSLVPLAPALVGHPAQAFDLEPRVVADAASEMIVAGPAEAFLAVLGSVHVLNFLSVITTGRRLRSLGEPDQARVISRASTSRVMLLRGASMLAGLPLKVAYYNHDDVCCGLGFTRSALREDAGRHQVTRDR